MRNPEDGITNLGDVPDGMTFYEATAKSRFRRKYVINPHHHSRRMTICETAREIWRESEKPQPDMAKIRELAAAAYDYGKRQNNRMVELRVMVISAGGSFD